MTFIMPEYICPKCNSTIQKFGPPLKCEKGHTLGKVESNGMAFVQSVIIAPFILFSVLAQKVAFNPTADVQFRFKAIATLTITAALVVLGFAIRNQLSGPPASKLATFKYTYATGLILGLVLAPLISTQLAHMINQTWP